MGKKKKREEEQKPWCYYCSRVFVDETTLIQHQKARHFQCSLCHKKMTTAPSLAIHCSHVHKSALTKVPNAKPGRDNIELEIFGMAGVPQEEGEEPASKIQRGEGTALPQLAVASHQAVAPVSRPYSYQQAPFVLPAPAGALSGGRPPAFPVPGTSYPLPVSLPYRPLQPAFAPGFRPPGLPNQILPGGLPTGPPGPLFPIANSTPAPLTRSPAAGLNAPDQRNGEVPSVSDAKLVWPEQTISMEERRAESLKYASKVDGAPSTGAQNLERLILPR